MASALEICKAAARKLLPSGSAWQVEDDTNFAKFLNALAAEPARLQERVQDFLREIIPLSTNEMLDNWERFLELPDECTPTDITLTLYDRRLRVQQKLVTGGGQSLAFFKLIVQQLGYNPDAFTIKNFKTFKAGRSKAGDEISNSFDANGDPLGWPHTMQVIAPAEFVERFKAGRSTAGQKLVLPVNNTLECVMRKFAPAHAIVLFSFDS